jgi:DNA-binding transcriptional LysR family regulator
MRRDLKARPEPLREDDRTTSEGARHSQPSGDGPLPPPHRPHQSQLEAFEEFGPLHHQEAAKDSLASLNAEPRGAMSVTAPSSFGRRILMPAVASFLERYPLLEVSLHLSDQLVDLAEQRIDVAVRIGALPNSDLIATRLAPIRLVVCASPSYLSRHGRPASLAQLTAHACFDAATRNPSNPMWCFEGVNHGKRLEVRSALRTDDKECMLQAAVCGAGIAHLPSWMASDDLHAGRLVALFPRAKPPKLKGPERVIQAVRMQGRSHDAKARLFIAHLKETFGETPSWERV